MKAFLDLGEIPEMGDSPVSKPASEHANGELDVGFSA